MPITALPTPPSRSDTVNFASRGDSFLGALPTFVTEANALETNVNNKEASATTSANTATTKAGEALTSANNAATSKTGADTARDAAVAARTAAEAALDSFDDRYLGPKATAPTLDNDGNALLTGALYWDTALPGMRSWNGTAWVTLPAATATAIANTPSGGITESTVQGAINGLDTRIISGIGKNKLINGNFGINQRAVSGTVVLAAGAYGHDRFKAGASGCTYTFATALNVTTLTISAGSLQQVVEGLNLQSGTHVLSWSGTAQGRIDGGAYGASGAVTATAVGGTNMTVEFNTGTLSKAQFETGSLASAFEQRLIGPELAMCQRYFEVVTTTASGVASTVSANRSYQWPIRFATAKRAVPTLVYSATTTNRCTSGGASNITTGGFSQNLNNTNTDGDDFSFSFTVTATAEL